MKKTKHWISILAAVMLCATAQAEMITMGGDQTAGTGTLTVNYDIVFTITTTHSGTALFLFDEVTVVDGSYDGVTFSGLEFSVNGGSKLGIQNWVDNIDGTGGDLTPNDGYIYGNGLSLTIGDSVTLHAGTGTMTMSNPSFNPWTSGDYDVFMASGISGDRISENGAVPEPATAGLLGISAIVFYALRRIKNFNRPV